jgi:pimeloyl-ACP methyl ester carboxylesterase
MFSLLLRNPSVALAARRFQSKSPRPSLSALDAGQTEVAVELNVEGIQDKQGAFITFPEPVKKMMIDNARTIAELRTRLPPFKTQLSRITCRTLVINGKNSPPWSRRIGEILAKSLKSAEATRIQGTRHFPHLEKPKEFNELVLAFIAAS